LTPTTGPLFPQILSTGKGVTPNVIYFDPHFQLPQIHQADLTADQDLGWNTVLSVSWLGSVIQALADRRASPDYNEIPLTSPELFCLIFVDRSESRSATSTIWNSWPKRSIFSTIRT
jgi:hypothetical protein